MTDLTERERDVARLVADGLRTKQIAAALGLSYRRVQRLYAAIAIRAGLDHGKDYRTQIAAWYTKSA